ncbi:MAG: Glucodextranase, domain [Verrucomicrobiota bacterium]
MIMRAALLLLSCLLPSVTHAVVTNTASVAGWCSSLAFEVGGAQTPTGPAQAAFSTYDGVAGRLLRQPAGDDTVVSAELRPRVGAFGLYETDYGLFRAGVFFEYGSMALSLPVVDADTNGVPDVVQFNQAGHGQAGGNGTQEYPQAIPFAASGQLTRNAGADLGNYSLAWTNAYGSYALAGQLRVLHFEGQADYTRDLTNQLRLTLTLRNQKGVSLVLTGSTAYTLPGPGEVVLPQFQLRSGSRRYTVQPLTLARAGQRYTGNLKFNDGATETAWRDYADWRIELTDPTDANTNGIPDFSDPLAGPDAQAPKVTVTVPAANARLTNEQVLVQGTASDDRGVTGVWVSLNGGPYLAATGTNSWSIPLSLVPGTNTVLAKAVDGATNASAVVTRRFVYVVTSPFALQVEGGGAVTPNLDGQLLEVGRQYAITAAAATGQLFAGWSGGLTSAAPRLTFRMTSNLVLRASFVPNPFLPLTGSYAGLFAEPGRVVHETAGGLTLRLTDRGAFSGQLRRAGRTLPFGGQFALDGKATNGVRAPGGPPLALTLCLDLTNGTQQITGEIAEDGSGVPAEVVADRIQPLSANNPAGRFAGQYTLTWPPVAGAGPLGAGVASAKTDTNGRARVTGFLADGAPFTAVGWLSKDGVFPVYQALYGNKGSLHVPLQFTNHPAAELMVSGTATWTRLPRPSDKAYRDGFRQELQARGSLYSAPALTGALAGAGSLQAALYGLPTPAATNLVGWDGTSRLTNGVGWALSLSPGTGLWTGQYRDPGTGRTLPFRAALRLPPGGLTGEGYLIQSNLSGRVTLSPVPAPPPLP